MNKRQHKKQLKKLMQMVVTPVEEVGGTQCIPAYGTKYLASNNIRLLFWDFMRLAKKHTIISVQWCKKENKPNIVQNVHYVCLVVYIKHYNIDI